MDNLFRRDRTIILDSLTKKTKITLSVERQIEVIGAIIEGIDDNQAPFKMTEARNMLMPYFQELQEIQRKRMAKDQVLEMVDPESLQDDHIKNGLVRDLNDRELEEFAENLKRVGMLHPAVVTPDYKILAGRQRTRAAIKAGFKKMPVIIRNAPTREEQLAIAISEEMLRRNVSPLEAYRCSRVYFSLCYPPSMQPENLIPELKQLISAPEAQEFLAGLPQESQNMLHQGLGKLIGPIATAAARKDTLETASLRERCRQAEDKIQQLEKLISDIKANMNELAEEKERMVQEAFQSKRNSKDRIRDLEWRLRNSNDTLARLEGEKKNLIISNTELQTKYERIALGKIEREVKVVEKEVFPEDYQELKREIERIKGTNKCLEAFWSSRTMLLGALSQNEKAIEEMGPHSHMVKGEITELAEACRDMAAKLEHVLNVLET